MRDLFAVGVMSASVILAAFVAPDPVFEGAEIICQGSILAVLPDMNACVAEIRRVPGWTNCACLRPPNAWSKWYWLFAVPAVLVVLGWLLLRGSLLRQCVLLAASIALGGILVLTYARATYRIDNEDVIFSLRGLAELFVVVAVCIVTFRVFERHIRNRLAHQRQT
jgi:hypothetical protein